MAAGVVRARGCYRRALVDVDPRAVSWADECQKRGPPQKFSPTHALTDQDWAHLSVGGGEEGRGGSRRDIRPVASGRM